MIDINSLLQMMTVQYTTLQQNVSGFNFNIHVHIHYLYKVKLDVEIVCYVWFAPQESDRKVSIVPSNHKIFWVMDVEFVLEGITQFKYQTILIQVRSNTEEKIEREDGLL